MDQPSKDALLLLHLVPKKAVTAARHVRYSLRSNIWLICGL